MITATHTRLLGMILLLVLLICSGCAGPTVQQTVDGPVVAVADISDTEKAKIRMSIIKDIRDGLSSYRLSPGDALEIMYHLAFTAEAQDYRIGVNDELNVDFFYQPA